MNLLALRSSRPAAAFAIAALTLLLCVPAQAARHTRRTNRAPAPAAPAATPTPAAPAGVASMVVAIEPETGALVPPRGDQVLRLSPTEATGLMRTSEGLTEVHLPDGTVMLDLQGRFMEFSVVQLDRQGRPRLHCVDDPASLRALLAPCAPAPTPRCEER